MTSSSYTNHYDILATPTFKLCLQKLLSFIERKYGQIKAEETKLKIRQGIEKLSKEPLTAPISDRLLEMGITDYRQLIIDKHNLVFFRIDAQHNKVVLVAVMDARQSIEKLLFEILLQQ